MSSSGDQNTCVCRVISVSLDCHLSTTTPFLRDVGCHTTSVMLAHGMSDAAPQVIATYPSFLPWSGALPGTTEQGAGDEVDAAAGAESEHRGRQEPGAFL